MTKRVLLSLWYAGRVMTHSRKSGQHLYDLAERVLPAGLADTPLMPEFDALRSIVADRYKAIGLLRPSAGPDVWSIGTRSKAKHKAISSLAASGEILPLEVDGQSFYASPEFVKCLDAAPMERKVTFVAPLDQLVWDRSALRFLFEFDYLWEVYVPEPKRRWGYYVLPVLWGDRFVARCDMQLLKGTLSVKAWHWEDHAAPDSAFWEALEVAFTHFATYCGATSVAVHSAVDKRVALVLGNAALER
jgi:hypothetical protein